MEWYVLPIVFVLDFVLGDPRYLPHPVRWMGKTITSVEPIFRKLPVRLSISVPFLPYRLSSHHGQRHFY